jgi:hypothetical protein
MRHAVSMRNYNIVAGIACRYLAFEEDSPAAMCGDVCLELRIVVVHRSEIESEPAEQECGCVRHHMPDCHAVRICCVERGCVQLEETFHRQRVHVAVTERSSGSVCLVGNPSWVEHFVTIA